MPITSKEVESRYPIHWLVWNNRHEELKSALQAKTFTVEDIEVKDPRGRTPLLLAITLAHIESARALIDEGADVNCEKDGWTAVQEATASGDPELLSLVLSQRDHKRNQLRADGVPDLLNRLSLAPDFYVEMKWEFTSWVPLVSRMCPFDTYKVYKRGANVRVDTTLVGFDQNRWQRGDITYIFRGQGRSARLYEVDHERGTLWEERLEVDPGHAPSADATPPSPPRPASPPPRALRQRLRQPIAINYLDTDKISFERNKSGVWGWRQDKTEIVNGYDCKVFGASNVELVSKTRTEHVPQGHRSRVSSPRAPLAGLLSLADEADDSPTEDDEVLLTREEGPQEAPITWEEYFSGEEIGERDIGRRKELTTKVQKFKATLWLCENYPLELQEQIMPILDLMASMSSPHFAKLKDFIQMQLPAGFPVKIEIPLFHVLNARITFGNIFALERRVRGVRGGAGGCALDDAVFALPPYRELGAQAAARPDDDALLHYAIRQSLLDAGAHDDQVDVWEALRGAPPAPDRDMGLGAHLEHQMLVKEETQLQRAIEASLASLSSKESPARPEPEELPEEDPFARALRLSALEQEARRQQQLAEEKQLEEALRLSLLEK